MLTRVRLLKSATVFLYIGPLVAGLSGFGWGMVPPFVSIFVLWLMILRPEQWPATYGEWLTGRAWSAALAQILSQILLVVVLFGVGRGIGGIAGFQLLVNPFLPIFISFIAIPVCRLIWDAQLAAESGLFLDEEAKVAQAPLIAAQAASAVAPLLELPDDGAEETVKLALASVLIGPATADRLAALDEALLRAERSHAALRRAVVVWATEPEIVAPGLISNSVSTAFRSTNRNPDLLRLFLPRALALAAAFPDRIAGFPAAEILIQAAESEMETGPHADLPAYLRADLKEGLMALAGLVGGVASPRNPVDTPRHDAGTPRTARTA